MSVMECDRNGCEQIMCDRLILEGSRHICEECYDELLMAKDNWPKKTLVSDVRDRIIQFMASEKRSFILVNTEDEFERLCQ